MDPLSIDVSSFKLPKAPESVYYIPEFVTEEEEEYLIKRVNEAPIPKWTQLSNRRLQNWGGDPHPKGMITERIPDWLKMYVNRVSDVPQLFPVGKDPNHVLVNEYLPGQGIMPHLDGPMFHPTITTISLGSHTVLNFYRPMSASNEQESTKPDSSASGWSDRLAFSIYVEPRSLLVLKDEAYNYYLHGIEEVKEDYLTKTVLNSDRILGPKTETEALFLARHTRISMTIRHVPGTKTSILKLLGKKT